MHRRREPAPHLDAVYFITPGTGSAARVAAASVPPSFPPIAAWNMSNSSGLLSAFFAADDLMCAAIAIYAPAPFSICSGLEPAGRAYTMATKSDCTQRFNQTLKRLAAMVAGVYPHNADVVRLKARIGLAVDYTPVLVIDLVGFYLMEFHEQIFAEDEAFFLANDFRSELTADGVDTQRAQEVAELIPTIKTLVAPLDAELKKRAFAWLQDMTRVYTDYRLAP